MVGSKDLPPSHTPFLNVFWYNQFKAKPQWPATGTSLAGKTAIITGSNTGLGYEAAVQLLGLQLSQLIMAVRSLERGESAAIKLRKQFPQAEIKVWQLDMASYDSVQAFVKRADSQLPRLDIAILNSGIIKMTYRRLETSGHEEALTVNYLSTMLLTVLLVPVMKSKRPPPTKAGQLPPPGRITIVSAALSLVANLPDKSADPLLPSFDNAKAFNHQDWYNSSKLLAHMFLWNLADRVSADDVIINLGDPAWCRSTNLARDAPAVVRGGVKLFGWATGRPPHVGASCFVDAVVNHGKESHGCFLMSWKIHPFAALLYTDEGKEITQRVWRETLKELEFAGLQAILDA
ncbi:hypothetical protein BX600DRAFT_468865 [Xylariales sp. PMI_506]|nr:hypothetical protein BX600DRAFT_468865 [Xylariales sp. PMI_506]